MRRARGFSLLELLVALAVLALLAVMGWRGLGAVLDAQAAVQAEARRWDDIQRVMQQLARDLSLALEPPVQQASGELLITRFGEDDALDVGPAQAGPRRVGYRLRAGVLEYVAYPRAGDAAASPVLENVAALELRALGADGRWGPLQREPRPGERPLRALAAELALAGGERVSRVFVLP